MKSVGFFHRYVRHNLGLKLVSLALAYGLWYLVVTGKIH